MASVRELTIASHDSVNGGQIDNGKNSYYRDVKICWNINGLGDKLGFQDLHEMIKSHDIIAFTETIKDKR